MAKIKRANAETALLRAEAAREQAVLGRELARVEKLYFPQPTPAPISKAAFGEEIRRRIAKANLNDWHERKEAAALYDAYLAMPDDPPAPAPVGKSADELRLEQRAMVDPAAYEAYLAAHPAQM